MKDLGLAKAWTEVDPDHRTTTNPVFWVEQGSGINAYLLEDAQGPVFFFKMVAAKLKYPGAWLEVHIQFNAADALRQARTRRGLMQGLRWLKNMLRENGFAGLYFHSKNPQLVYFCINRLGLEWDGKRILKKVR